MAIDHCLASLRQSEPEDIEIVRSHPQALSQCATTIERMGWESIPSANTAVAARDVAKEKRLNVAAICSRKAAETYGLKLLDSHIQDDRYNTTRFIVISGALPDREREQDQPLSDAAPRRGRALQPVVPLPLAGTQPHQNREPSHSGQGF